MTAPGKARKRRSELRRRQNRRAKIHKLKTRYQTAKTDAERKQILDKLLKITPHYPVHEFQSAAP